MGVELSEDQVASILAEAERALLPFVGSGGELRFDMSAHIVTATRQ